MPSASLTPPLAIGHDERREHLLVLPDDDHLLHER